ncbi:4-hydroxy-2-oxoglutarate aldolase, mitochondrial-like [Neocloeon triangulifer]|uniref:4-hydroxy-2-oxoglutarate aldolase, mitochondrial-like n=1 Tax=Neocloeon triangulifer TaxID=2078957 RepID=UPI00286ED66F|nr:4-hydroxy-2-oxoglutarate aldolase, mitochondrial-like [Neocloeon triangulifer]
MASRKITTGLFTGLKSIRNFSSAPSLDLSGVFPPIPTPFNADETLAFDKLEQNFRVWQKFPFRGYLVQGSNGEFKLLKDEERVEMVRKSRQFIPKDKLLLAGSACESTEATIEMSNLMADAGADAVLIINPSYYKSAMNDEALFKYFWRVADECRIPVVLYNMPGNTGIDLNPALIAKLAKHPNIIGLKDSGADVGKMAQVVHMTKDLSFQVLSGSAGLLLPALLVGCVGGINGFANTNGQELCQLVSLFRSGRMAEAAELQRKIMRPNALITRMWGVPATKAVMDAGGQLYGGPCRQPLMPLTDEQRKVVFDEFVKEGFLKL